MKSARHGALALLHKGTERRYSLDGEKDLVIGRQTGDLIFDHDPKLSGKHCLIRAAGDDFVIHDLKSRTGISINGSALPQGKACVLKPGLEIAVGNQLFLVVDEKPNAGRASEHLLTALALVALLLGSAAVFEFFPGTLSRAVSAAKPMNVDQELQEAYTHYRNYGESMREHKLSNEQSLSYLENDLIPRFKSLHNELQAIDVSHHELTPHREFQRRMAGTLLGQTIAMANYIKTKDIRYSVEIEQYNQVMRLLNEEYAKRQSANTK